MFSIEQANGTHKKVNTIDELIIEYIKKYANSSGNGGSGSINEEQLNELKNKIAQCALTTDLSNYVSYDFYNTDILKYATEDELTNAINALKSVLNNDLSDYRKKDDSSVKYTKTLNYKTQNQSGYDWVQFDKELLENTHLIGYLIDNDVRKDFDMIVKKGEADEWGNYYCVISDDYVLFTGSEGLAIVISNDDRNRYNTYITEATVEMNDEYALKTDINDLKEAVEESSVFTQSYDSVDFVDEKYNLSITTNTLSTPFQIDRKNNHEEYRINSMFSLNEFDKDSIGNAFRVNFENDAVKIITEYNTFDSGSIENTISFLNTGGIVIDNLQNSDGVRYALETPTNTTITHYCPIEPTINSIEDFIIGAPVYLTGNVYKSVEGHSRSASSSSARWVKPTVEDRIQWIPSTESDTTDCICSVKTKGTWKEYVGICVRIDIQKNCVTFASLGDYLVKVDDTSCYAIGDEVFIDNEDNKLKILSGETAITSKIKRMTVGIITGIIDGKTLAMFK